MYAVGASWMKSGVSDIARRPAGQLPSAGAVDLHAFQLS
jgi:hypothetical protein